MSKLWRLISPSIKRRLTQIEMAQTYNLVVNPDFSPLEGQVAVVTGASGAIGRAIAIQLAACGAHVIAVGRDSAKLTGLVAEISSLNGSAEAEVVDLTDASEIAALASRVGPTTVLVNNAGGSSRSKSAHIWEQLPETIDEVLSINLRTVMLTTAAFGAQMIAAERGGRIINLGSSIASGGLSRFSEYAAAKAGVVGFTRSAALEFGVHGITVNCVSPGIVQRGVIDQRTATRTLSKAVLPRLGRAEDIAQMVGFVAGPGAEWITGQEFIVDGGRSIGLHGEF